MEWIDLLQWPAMPITIGAAWLTAALSAGRRKLGFWLFLLSNVLWIAWGWHTAAWALVVLQLGLVAMNIRGASKNDDAADDSAQREDSKRGDRQPESGR
ncbi:MAG: hypothetical protein M3Y32_12740 [Pseudomonadota bacterium]|nr:hypothetical protein [Pseudomonadota bacterium]